VFLVITKDVFFLNALIHLLGKYEIIHITSVDQICNTRHKHAYVIVDSLNNNIFHTEIGKKLRTLAPAYAYVISPFAIKKCLGNTPTVFLDRDANIFEFIRTLERGYNFRNTAMLSFSHKQHQILTLIVQEVPGEDIAELLRISRKTFYSHKYNIMLLLKLRKMCDLVKLSIAQYLV
jgi:DNA-binding CsgD family transcriptional regulator